jgi:tRNA nucleotidyltransferase/poly(A) polymerase
MPARAPHRAFQILRRHPVVRALLEACGATECHLVGGVLRDRALGLPVKDFDAVVSGRGREIGERLATALPARLVALGGKEFAAFRLVGEEIVLDLWDREDVPLHQDLARRDFTVNSFAFAPRTGEVIDPFGGLDDLGRRVLRATTPESFSGDPLRVLRLPRLLLSLPGFTTDPETLELARQAAPRLLDVAAERVREEISYLFGHPDAARGLAVLMALDLYPGLWLGRPGEPGPPGTALAEIEALPVCRRQLEELAPDLAIEVDARAARLAALFAGLADPAGSLRLFRDAGTLTRQTAADVALLLADGALPEDELGRRRFLHRTGRLWPTAACALAARMAARGQTRWREALADLVDLARREGAVLLDPPRLLTGEDVQEILGISAGPAVGQALAAVRAAQVDGKVRSRDEAAVMVKGMALT